VTTRRGPASIDDVRQFALSLPEVTEQDHHGMPSFRVRNRIFATVPDDGHVRVMAPEEEILGAVEQDPSACAPFYWGKRLACVVVTTAAADREQLHGLLEDAYLHKAPRALREQIIARDDVV
jgi:hypothetical protein